VNQSVALHAGEVILVTLVPLASRFGPPLAVLPVSSAEALKGIAFHNPHLVGQVVFSA